MKLECRIRGLGKHEGVYFLHLEASRSPSQSTEVTWTPMEEAAPTMPIDTAERLASDLRA